MADRKNGRTCSTGQSPQWAVVPMEEDEEEEELGMELKQSA